ncbi:hypothetical protein BDQ12DRAFT_667650 [Crucibulum laeve]|uniref:Uncharacterized protein n=1 Tax=Crucibulum laeve TaxID=68775 RepID=A0A5C3LWK3_9AGAR|nr:hypothetical protein BDQ12DRAFT_667650 [Crucibulum laeve]
MTKYTNPQIPEIQRWLSIVSCLAAVGVLLSFLVILGKLVSIRKAIRQKTPPPPNEPGISHAVFKVIILCGVIYAATKIIYSSVEIMFTSEGPATFNVCAVILHSMILVMILVAPARINIARDLERQNQAHAPTLPRYVMPITGTQVFDTKNATTTDSCNEK